MKEATGELSTTVITVVAIAAISTLFIVFLYPTLKRQIVLTQACNNGPGYRAMSGDKDRINCTAAATSGSNKGQWTCEFYEGASSATAGGTLKGNKTCNVNTN